MIGVSYAKLGLKIELDRRGTSQGKEALLITLFDLWKLT